MTSHLGNIQGKIHWIPSQARLVNYYGASDDDCLIHLMHPLDARRRISLAGGFNKNGTSGVSTNCQEADTVNVGILASIA